MKKPPPPPINRWNSFVTAYIFTQSWWYIMIGVKTDVLWWRSLESPCHDLLCQLFLQTWKTLQRGWIVDRSRMDWLEQQYGDSHSCSLASCSRLVAGLGLYGHVIAIRHRWHRGPVLQAGNAVDSATIAVVFLRMGKEGGICRIHGLLPGPPPQFIL